MARRKSQERKLKPAILIFTEGITEKKYFEKLNQKYSTKIAIKVSETRKQGLDLVEEANKVLKNPKNPMLSKYKADFVYVIFDKDDLEESNLLKAAQKAEDYQFKIGFSNEAIEVWLLSHFEIVNKKMSREQLNQKLSKFLGGKYTKTDEKQLDKLVDLVDNALRNTTNMAEKIDFSKNPYTNLGSVVREIYGI